MDNIRNLYAKNAVGLRAMLTKAEQTGRKVNGFTADFLREKVAIYTALSAASDMELRAHFAKAIR